MNFLVKALEKYSLNRKLGFGFALMLLIAFGIGVSGRYEHLHTEQPDEFKVLFQSARIRQLERQLGLMGHLSRDNNALRHRVAISSGTHWIFFLRPTSRRNRPG